ncbi:hypothetical protein [Streptomyces sp. NPDC056948]|uniref:hypothetical protein n=1 Tax=Streptomyces sp. NPDC056948 TaxID=3345975 RepID=UPI003625CB0A
MGDEVLVQLGALGDGEQGRDILCRNLWWRLPRSGDLDRLPTATAAVCFASRTSAAVAG